MWLINIECKPKGQVATCPASVIKINCKQVSQKNSKINQALVRSTRKRTALYCIE